VLNGGGTSINATTVNGGVSFSSSSEPDNDADDQDGPNLKQLKDRKSPVAP